MLGASLLPAASCAANGKVGAEKSNEVVVANDESIFNEKMAIAVRDGYAKLPIGDRVVAMGKLLLGIPYVGGTLEVDSLKESLVTNFRGLDCVTFYENSLAMARSLKLSGTPSFAAYQSELATLRYRGGDLNDFASRLHYSSDYFFDNEKRGTMRNVTAEVGGALATRDNRRIDFMSTHPSAYKQIRASADQLEKIRMIEEDMHLRGGYMFIPKASVAKIEKKIQNGDIIGITTSIKGLDMSHTGIAVRGDDGVLRFMHASSALNKVVISEGSLSDYLATNGKQTGIVVMRPLEVAAN
jgi:hypothetical protein